MPRSRARKQDQNLVQAVENPSLFAEVMLGRQIWLRQHEILQSVAHHKKTAVRACHASGKTFTAAALVLWWIAFLHDAIAVTTAPTWTQVERLLWGEIHKLVRGARIRYPVPTATELHFEERYAIGLSTNEGVRFQGFHGNVLIVIDEAPGVQPEIWEAVESIRAGGDVRVLALGNPTIASGPFYDAFTANREGWNLISISAFDTPNLAGITVEQLLKLSEQELNQNPCPYLTTRAWVKEKYLEWGPGHPLWESRVLGNFPSADPYGLIPLSWIELAKIREETMESSEPVEAGVDVAEGGDNETVVCVRRGGHVIVAQGWSARDARGPVAEFLKRHGVRNVKVDKVGVGAYFEKHLRDLGFNVLGVNVGEAPRNRERFANLKAELYWALRDRFESGQISGALSERMVSQLAAIRYECTPKGQIAMEAKEKMARRGVKSPDWAEALMLAFAPMQRKAEWAPVISLTRESPWKI